MAMNLTPVVNGRLQTNGASPTTQPLANATVMPNMSPRLDHGPLKANDCRQVHNSRTRTATVRRDRFRQRFSLGNSGATAEGGIGRSRPVTVSYKKRHRRAKKRLGDGVESLGGRPMEQTRKLQDQTTQTEAAGDGFPLVPLVFAISYSTGIPSLRSSNAAPRRADM